MVKMSQFPKCTGCFKLLNNLLSKYVSAKDAKKVREKIKKLASKVEEDDFAGDLNMVCRVLLPSVSYENKKIYE